MYADDTNRIVAGSSKYEIQHKINIDLENVRSWLYENRLSLNTTKSELLFVGSTRRSSRMSCPSLLTGDANVPKVTFAKSLGVHIDEALKWATHIEETSKKMTSVIGALKRVRQFVPASTLRTMYNSFIKPYFVFCYVVWEGLGSELALKLQKLHNRAARIIPFPVMILAPAPPARARMGQAFHT